MTIKWTPEGKVAYCDEYDELARALDVAVAALRHYADSAEYPIVAQSALRQIGVDDDAR